MLPDYRERTKPLDTIGFILFGAGLALLSYVLEVFGEHALGAGEILGLLAVSLALLFGYGVHAERTRHPLLRLGLFRTRSFAAAVGGGFITRLGIGGVPFLLPLLYQVGLGFSPVQSGLLIMPQAAAGLGTKIVIGPMLRRYGYRTVLIGNTLAMSVFLMLFATIGMGTPVWLIVAIAFCYGALTSTQYTSMNTLTYVDVTPGRTSAASSLASTSQQLAISFGVAVAGLVTMALVPEAARSSPREMISGLHHAFLALGVFTAVSTIVFARLKPGDGAEETMQKDIHLG
jgi:MFS family permease